MLHREADGKDRQRGRKVSSDSDGGGDGDDGGGGGDGGGIGRVNPIEGLDDERIHFSSLKNTTKMSFERMDGWMVGWMDGWMDG
ncbi:hypothetical protein HZH68_014026 [Vespula germanica]|uniref:Uncharacterized protein n=1 Tax=Vespula germanica TaxID=30212 RepID=A0A834JBS0_VESGE|nr:hypothetical protein HZH68_014026 [Vespula germanica]